VDVRTKVAIVGAGPAGLAVGACLRRAGLDFIIFEKDHAIAPAWRRHYERLHLHTVKHYSSLPFVPFPKSYPRYVPRDLMMAYLTSYADAFEIRPRFGEAVVAVRREDTHWVVETPSTRALADHVVVASGGNAAPCTPEIAGLTTFKGKLLHSAEYRTAAGFAGQTVLVIGMGNTGAEIALDLAEAGARPTISVRDGVHIVPRDLFGVPIQLVAMMATRVLPRRANDRLFPFILDLALGNLARYGIKRPEQGLLQQVASASRIPVIDVGTVRRIADGTIKIAGDIAEVTDDGAVFQEGGHTTFDAIITATGYRPNYQDFLAPLQTADPGVASGPYFVGFQNKVTGLLREISIEAAQIVADINRRAIDPPDRRVPRP
jgi:cation diffusion facilitator CzcD-associated flavoprotein CzcO